MKSYHREPKWLYCVFDWKPNSSWRNVTQDRNMYNINKCRKIHNNIIFYVAILLILWSMCDVNLNIFFFFTFVRTFIVTWSLLSYILHVCTCVIDMNIFINSLKGIGSDGQHKIFYLGYNMCREKKNKQGKMIFLVSHVLMWMICGIIEKYL